MIRNLEVLGEAAKHVPSEIRALHPGIDWRGMTGLRDVLAHDYFDVDEDILWMWSRGGSLSCAQRYPGCAPPIRKSE